MKEELGEPCATVVFMTNLVYDRGVALEYDLVNDRLEDARRRLADLDDMIPQVYGLTDLTTPEERENLVRALGRVKRYIQEEDTTMAQGAADEFNASFRSIMWNIVIRCRERAGAARPVSRTMPPESAESWGIYMEITYAGDTEFHVGDIISYEEFIRVNDRVSSWGKTAEAITTTTGPPAETGRLFPKSYSDWVDLSEDIKSRDPSIAFMVNAALGDIADETKHADEQKRWLIGKAGELGIK